MSDGFTDTNGQSFAQRLEAEKLAALAEFAAGAGHEINNPLAVISGRAQLLLAGEKDPERRRELATIHRQALRIREMISDLMHFARPAQPRLARLDLREVVSNVIERLQLRAHAAGVELSWQPPESALYVRGDRNQLSVALSAVVENAIDAIELKTQATAANGSRTLANPSRNPLPAYGTVRVGASKATATDGRDWARMEVADDGPGFGPEIRRHLFDPYFSGRSAGRGAGMGLCKCWRILTLHGGAIEADSETGQGARFALLLPFDESRSSAGAIVG